jgi:hypothetical protein
VRSTPWAYKLTGTTRSNKLENRIQKAEELLMQRMQHMISTQPNNLPFTTDSSSDASQDSPASDHVSRDARPIVGHGNPLPIGRLDFAGHQVGGIGSYNGVPFFSAEGCRWFFSRTGREPSFPSPFMNLLPWQRAEPPTLIVSENRTLPERRVVEQYYSAFRSSSFRLSFPLIDDHSFKEAVHLAFTPQYEQSAAAAVVAAKACVLTFLGVMILMDGKLEVLKGLPILDAEQCMNKAQHMIHQVMQDTNVMVLQIYTMQVSDS